MLSSETRVPEPSPPEVPPTAHVGASSNGEGSQSAHDYADAPIQVCPSPRHDYIERAANEVSIESHRTEWPGRREWLRVLPGLKAVFRWMRTTGRVDVGYYSKFRDVHCPLCGARLESRCPACSRELTSVKDTHCRQCGRQFPWARAREQEGQLSILDDWKNHAERAGEAAGIEVLLLQHSITKLVVDAVVSGDDEAGGMRGDAASAILYEGGSAIETESMQMCVPESAWTTSAGTLPAKRVVHVPLMNSELRTSAARIQAAVASAVEVAQREGIRSMAFPAFGTGTGGMSPGLAGTAMGLGLRGVPSIEGPLESVVIVLYKDSFYDDFAAALIQALDGEG